MRRPVPLQAGIQPMDASLVSSLPPHELLADSAYWHGQVIDLPSTERLSMTRVTRELVKIDEVKYGQHSESVDEVNPATTLKPGQIRLVVDEASTTGRLWAADMEVGLQETEEFDQIANLLFNWPKYNGQAVMDAAPDARGAVRKVARTALLLAAGTKASFRAVRSTALEEGFLVKADLLSLPGLKTGNIYRTPEGSLLRVARALVRSEDESSASALPPRGGRIARIFN